MWEQRQVGPVWAQPQVLAQEERAQRAHGQAAVEEQRAALRQAWL